MLRWTQGTKGINSPVYDSGSARIAAFMLAATAFAVALSLATGHPEQKAPGAASAPAPAAEK